MVEALTNLPVIELIVLAAVTAIVRLVFLAPGEPPTAVGAAIMAAGIFGLGALQRLPLTAGAIRLLALELLVIWVSLAGAFVNSYLKGNFRRHIDDPVGCFAIGTWVAGTSVLANLLNATIPGLRHLAMSLALVAWAIWFGYVLLIIGRFFRIARNPAGLHVTGRILLSTVSTQSLVVVASALFLGLFPSWLSAGLIALGCVFYVAGLGLIIERYMRQRGWRLEEHWDNTNCIIHGAMSITGLAAIQSRAVPEGLIIWMWVWAAVMFVVVEAIEIVRLWLRVRAYGWAQAAFTYNVSQWARNFTFGMFYMLTLHLYAAARPSIESNYPVMAAIQVGIISWGQYVVFFLLIFETALFFAHSTRVGISRRWLVVGSR